MKIVLLQIFLASVLIMACAGIPELHASELTAQEQKKLECRNRVHEGFRQSADMALLSEWCVDSYMLSELLKIAEAKRHRQSFEAILALGVKHPAPDCARLIISLANYDLSAVTALLDKGVPAGCGSQLDKPMAVLFASRPPDRAQATRAIQLLVDAGAQVRPGDILISIRSGNHLLLAEGLKFRDANFGLGQQTDARVPTRIINPLILAITLADEEAVAILIDANTDTSPGESITLIETEDGVRWKTAYSFYHYARRQLRLFRNQLAIAPGDEELLARNQHSANIVALLRPGSSQSSWQDSIDKSFALERRRSKLLAAISQKNHGTLESMLSDLDPNFGLEHSVPDPRRYWKSRRIKTDDLMIPLVLALTLADSNSVDLLLQAGADADQLIHISNSESDIEIEQLLGISDAESDAQAARPDAYSIREYGRNVLYAMYRRSRTFSRGWETMEREIEVISMRLGFAHE